MTVLLIDDLRSFRDDRPCEVARTSAQGLARLAELRELDELWLDHDLGADDTIEPVSTYLAERTFHGAPYPVTRIYVHSMNPVGADKLAAELIHWGYSVRRVPCDDLISEATE